MLRNQAFRLSKILFLAASMLMLFGVSATHYAKRRDFHFACFNISLVENLNLILKTEEKNNGFYRYIFASSNSDAAEQQIRVIVSTKNPEANQSLVDFQLASIGAMSAMFMDSYGLYQYIDTPENQKVLSGKPYTLNLGKESFAGATMYFGDTDASFLVARSHNMTYAFTLISKNSNEQVRKNNLKALIEQLQSIQFLSCSE
jgi:hypothetical protein